MQKQIHGFIDLKKYFLEVVNPFLITKHKQKKLQNTERELTN